MKLVYDNKKNNTLILSNIKKTTNNLYIYIFLS